MTFEQTLELIKTVSDSELTVFQYEEGNQKIVMQTTVPVTDSASGATGFGNETNQGTEPANNHTAIEVTDVSSTAKGEYIKSPLVGRFYQASEEGGEPFVKVGDTVKKGQVLGIIEAMKLMNEIESEYDGVVTEILAKNEQSVEYGQPLFCIQK